MKTTLALAACAALSLAAAACGDDDDDASDDSTELTTPAAPDTAAADTAASEDSAANGAATEAAGTLSEDDAEILADCEAFGSVLQTDLSPPAAGEEITDEYRSGVEGAIDALDDLDLSTDGADAARDDFKNFLEDIVDADTMTEELQDIESRLSDEAVEFTNACNELTSSG